METSSAPVPRSDMTDFRGAQTASFDAIGVVPDPRRTAVALASGNIAIRRPTTLASSAPLRSGAGRAARRRCLS